MVGSPFTARARVKEPSRPYSPKPFIFLLALYPFPRCRRACLYPQLCVYLIIPAGIRGGSLTRPLFTNDPQRLTLYEVFDVLVKVRVVRPQTGRLLVLSRRTALTSCSCVLRLLPGPRGHLHRRGRPSPADRGDGRRPAARGAEEPEVEGPSGRGGAGTRLRAAGEGGAAILVRSEDEPGYTAATGPAGPTSFCGLTVRMPSQEIARELR